MRLTFLGTGTSFGIPVVGCDCQNCTSLDPRDRRTRSGALVRLPGGTLLVDTPPELRVQLVREGVRRIDAVWYTHVHADHVHGIDDLRVFTVGGRPAITAYTPDVYEEVLRARFRYIFDPTVRPPAGSSKPAIELMTLSDGVSLEILGTTFTPFAVPHGSMPSYGFRVGPLGYVTDAKRLPSDVVNQLRGVEVLVLNALWFGNPHPTHFNVEEAVEAAAAVGAKRTYLVHLTHRVGHEELLGRLPQGVEPAYDGLSVDL